MLNNIIAKVLYSLPKPLIRAFLKRFIKYFGNQTFAYMDYNLYI